VRLLLILLAVLQAGCPSSPPPIEGGAAEAAPVCDPSTCGSGCCTGSVCQPGNTSAACGVTGLPCVVCEATESCSKGQCVITGAQCTPLTCPNGCCQDDQCQNGSAREACGKGGGHCTACSSTQACTGQTCICGTATCKGCCDGATCRTGTTAAACGSGGVVCKKCGSAEGCVNGLCKNGGSCSASSCLGCCEGTICKGGTAKDACGQNGRTCQTCGATESCLMGICNDSLACGPSSCPLGCCQASKCLEGSTSAACGKGGGLCTSCTYPKTCQSGGCALDPTSQWGVTVVSAELDPNKSWNVWPFNPAPDAYVVVESAGKSANTSTQSATYNPSWGEYLFSLSAGTLVSTSLTVSVWAKHTLYSDALIGQCSLSLDASVLLAGGGTAPCGPYVFKIELSFTLF
jgi:hypothetical protein